MTLQRHHSKHRGIASRSNRHGVAGAHALRQRHQPIALRARTLRIHAEVRLAATPAVEDHLVARFPVGMCGSLDGTRAVDAGDHREAAHDRRLTGDGETVFVIDRRPFGPKGDIALHQIVVVKIRECSAGAAFALGDDDGLECSHGTPFRYLLTQLSRIRAFNASFPADA